jgi:hypothetical protein
VRGHGLCGEHQAIHASHHGRRPSFLKAPIYQPENPLPFLAPVSLWMLTTFLDGVMRISRDDEGRVFVMVKVRDGVEGPCINVRCTQTAGHRYAACP